MGSSKIITIEYTIDNSGEAAYNAQLQIKTNIKYSRIPSECYLNKDLLLCSINNEPIIWPRKFKISLDATKLVTNFTVYATVTSSGIDVNPFNNKRVDKIIVISFSDVKITSISSQENISRSDCLIGVSNITMTFELQNLGPSNIRTMNGIINVPISYTSLKEINAVDIIDRVSATGRFNGVTFKDFDWLHNNASLVQKPISNTNFLKREEKLNIFNLIEHSNEEIYDCNVPSSLCINGRFKVHDFSVGNEPILITLYFQLKAKHFCK